MTPENPVDVVGWRGRMDILAARFGDEVYRIVAAVAVSGAEVRAAGPDQDPAATAATARVVAGLDGIAAAAADLRRSVDLIVRQMIAASRAAGSVPDSAGAIASDVNRLVQAVLLTREIDSMATDVAGLTNLLGMPLSVGPVRSPDDVPAAVRKIGSLADDAVWAIGRTAAELVGIQREVADALTPPSLAPRHDGRGGFPAEFRAA